MLAVSVVYRGWQSGDWFDAYLPETGEQIILIQRHDTGYTVYFMRKWVLGTIIYQAWVKSNYKLWIDEGIEGIAA